MRSAIGALLVAGTISAASAASTDRWIHVRVDDAEEGGHVDIQVPISMVSGLLPTLKSKSGSGSIRFEHSDVDLDDLRAYWAAVRDSKDGDYVTVRDKESKVRVAKRSGQLLVDVDEAAGGGHVHMKLPVGFVDAVLSHGDTVDLQTIGRALDQVPSGEILTVDDDDSHVRIWIDGAPSPSRDGDQ